jgi:twitching motility protein PilU
MDLSLNLKGIISQRLIPRRDSEGRVPAVEVMLNTPLMSDLIFKGHVHEIKELMAKSNELGMHTFDQALFDLYESGYISYEDALRNADSLNDLRLRIKLESKGSKKEDIMSGLDSLFGGRIFRQYHRQCFALACILHEGTHYEFTALPQANVRATCF